MQRDFAVVVLKVTVFLRDVVATQPDGGEFLAVESANHG